MKSLFKSEAAKASMLEWFERFRARLTVPTERREVTTRFGSTHVLVGGPLEAPPLVVLHGAMASSAHALVELAPLLERFRVYAVDVIGQSPKSADARLSAKNDDYGWWLVDVLDALKLPRVHLVGVSWGGFASIRLAAVAPSRIDRLALLVPAGVVSGSWWTGLTQMGLPMTRYLLSPTEARLTAFVANLVTTPDDAEWRSYLGTSFLSYELSGMAVPKLATPDELARFAAPTLVIAADRDVSFPGRQLLDRATQLFTGLGQTELLENCRHCPPTTPEFRARLGATVTNFLLDGAT